VRSALCCAIAAAAAALWAQAAGPAHRIPAGFTEESAALHRDLEGRLSATLSRERVGADFRELTREPHPAGSQRNNELAGYVATAFREAGLDAVIETSYDVLMSYPEEVVVELTAPHQHSFTLAEDVLPEDPDSGNPRLGLPYHAYSASGEVAAEVVYARNGNPEDFEYLRSRGIDLKGKIALMRYSVPYSYRGFKAYTAERLGLAGMLIYSDPKDDGFVKGKVYPDGPWGPTGHIQRGAITYDFLVPGDPLTPGWASLTGAQRIPESEAAALPRIMSAPIAARDAQMILAALGGEQAPEDWRGALEAPWRIGPGPAVVHMKLKIPRPITKIINVEGRIRGLQSPQEMILLGNHRDAWAFGGVDPSSGTATMLELARGLGSLSRAGWRPRRTIVFASWDAEEFALTGSTEWGEQHRKELEENLVAYLNVDSSTSGQQFSASASGCLATLVEEVLADVADPATGRTLLERWRSDGAGGGATPLSSGAGTVSAIGSGSDHTVFLNLIGAPVLDMTFEGDYGVYHSAYDSYLWMAKFGDPGFRYMTTMAEVWGRMALRLASAEVLPLDYEAYGERIGGFLTELEGKRADKRVRSAVRQFTKAGRSINRVVRSPQQIAALPPERREQLNRGLIRAERALCDKNGLPDRPWFKHLIYACRYTYLPLTLPGLTEAVESGDAAAVAGRERILAEALARAAASLK